MTIQEIRNLIVTTNRLGFNANDKRDVYELIGLGKADFTVNGYRFIHYNHVQEVLKQVFNEDVELLGKMSPIFISITTGFNSEVIKKAQKLNAFEIIGCLMHKYMDEVVYYIHAFSEKGYAKYLSNYDTKDEKLGRYYYFKI